MCFHSVKIFTEHRHMRFNVSGVCRKNGNNAKSIKRRDRHAKALKSHCLSLSLMQSQIENLNERAWKPESHTFARHKGIQSARHYGWIWYLAMISQLVTRIQWNQALCCICPRVDWGNCLTMIVTCAALTPLVISRVPRGVYRCFQFAQCTVFEQPNEQSRTEKTDGENSNRVELFILGWFFCDTNIHLRDGWLLSATRSCQTICFEYVCMRRLQTMMMMKLLNV